MRIHTALAVSMLFPLLALATTVPLLPAAEPPQLRFRPPPGAVIYLTTVRQTLRTAGSISPSEVTTSFACRVSFLPVVPDAVWIEVASGDAVPASGTVNERGEALEGADPLVNEFVPQFPSHPATAGTTWSRSGTFGPLGLGVVQATFRYAGTEQFEGHRVGVLELEEDARMPPGHCTPEVRRQVRTRTRFDLETGLLLTLDGVATVKHLRHRHDAVPFLESDERIEIHRTISAGP